MGWYFTEGATPADIRQEITEDQTRSDGGTFKTLRSKLMGRVLWTLHESTKADGEVRKWIGCYLLENNAGYGWGYKPMDESMGPYYHSCPLAYLDEASPPINDTAKQWREQVREKQGS